MHVHLAGHVRTPRPGKAPFCRPSARRFVDGALKAARCRSGLSAGVCRIGIRSWIACCAGRLVVTGEHLEMLSSHCGVHTAHVSCYVPHGMKQVVQPAPGLVAAGPVLLNGQSTSVPIPVSAHVSFATTAHVQRWGPSVRLVACMKDRGTCKERELVPAKCGKTNLARDVAADDVAGGLADASFASPLCSHEDCWLTPLADFSRQRPVEQ